MRKLFLFDMVTLDGFFEGPNREIDWHTVDEEFNEFAIQQLETIDLLLFGRITYELMASYWPTPAAIHDDPIVAKKMNNIAKVVYSTTLTSVPWSYTRLIRKKTIRETEHLKKHDGRDMAVFGSAILANSLLDAGLVDEIRLMVAPIVLGRGRPFFGEGGEKRPLKLTGSRTFGNGNVLLTYQPLNK